MKVVTELRDSCIDCVRKHLSQALVLMQEVHQGYPKHHWIAVGHLGEAADEALKEFPKLAAEIRKHRIKYMADPHYSVPVLDLIEKAKGYVKGEAKMTKDGQAFVSDEISHLMKDGPSKGPQKGKKMPQKQAIAVALDVARREGFKSSPAPKTAHTETFNSSQASAFDSQEENMSIFDSIVQQENSNRSLFDGIAENYDDHDEHSHAEPPPSHWDREPGADPGKHDSWDAHKPAKPSKGPWKNPWPDVKPVEPRLDKAPYKKEPGPNSTHKYSEFDEFDEVGESESMFDALIKNRAVEESSWNDRVARTMTLADELIGLRSPAQ